jgi:arginine decarboxylase
VGHVTVSPRGDRGGSLDLYELVQALRQRNLDSPILIRFSDILADRLERLQACFTKAIARYQYPNVYRGVFPIKCNQHRHLVETLVNAGKAYQFGLEIGSKPELMIALATLEPDSTLSDNKNHPLVICNGYKDQEYFETALLATRLGQKPIIVIEQPRELPLLLQVSRQLRITPMIGVRAKLQTKGIGRWGNSTGDRAKFGLTILQIIEVVQQLQAADMLECLQLLHFHIGSQISAISAIKDAIREASQIYGELVRLGAKMGYLDVGGGLAVDYDGSKTNLSSSKNYNLQNYANDIVAEVKEACEAKQIPAPILISESGRAIASHQSVLVFDILGMSNPPLADPPSVAADEHLIIRNLGETYASITQDNCQEAYHDAIQFKDEAVSLFNFGYLSMAERAKVEQLYWACCHKIFQLLQQQDEVSEDLAQLERSLTAIYYGNFSVFQSIPDAWAIDQLFPILPIHRLDTEPTQRGVIVDLSCDSDGRLDQFIAGRPPKESLELHSLEADGENSVYPYYLGIFLVGAYQETMGNLHNLFGDPNVVHVSMTPRGYQLEHVVKGDTIEEVLGYAQYNPKDLVETIRQRTEQALQNNQITLAESQRLLQNYENSLTRYTYLI